MRFRNDTGSVITVNDLGQTVGPYEEFDWPGWSREVHGVVPGCSLLDPEDSEAEDGGGQDTDPGTGTGTSGPGTESPQASGTPPADTTQDTTTGASAEEPQE